MEIITFLAADYANIADGGKLNVMGIFNNIYATKFPARHNSMVIVIKMRANLGEYGEQRTLTIALRDEDGNEMIQLKGDVLVPKIISGQVPEVNAVLDFKDIVFPKPGRYQFTVLVDKDYKGSLGIDVIQADMSRSKESGG